MSGETWLLIVAVIGTASLIYFGVKTARDQKLSNSRKDRRLTFLATTITAFALVPSAWQNRPAANDAKDSVEASRDAAASSKDSADSARASLAIEKAAALTLLWQGFCQEAWLFGQVISFLQGADESYGTADALVGCSTVDQNVIRGSSPHDADSGELHRAKGAHSHGG